MAYEIDRSSYSQNTITNTETGVTLTQWDQVTIGKSKTVWDIAEIVWHDGDVRLHRQSETGAVTYRRINMDRLTRVAPVEEAEEVAPETPKTPEQIAAAVEDCKAEILEDIRTGVVPANVADFSSLHDYVDANEYAGFCDNDRRADWTVEGWASVQEIVDTWLRNGRKAQTLTEAVATAEPVRGTRYALGSFVPTVGLSARPRPIYVLTLDGVEVDRGSKSDLLLCAKSPAGSPLGVCHDRYDRTLQASNDRAGK